MPEQFGMTKEAPMTDRSISARSRSPTRRRPDGDAVRLAGGMAYAALSDRDGGSVSCRASRNRSTCRDERADGPVGAICARPTRRFSSASARSGSISRRSRASSTSRPTASPTAASSSTSPRTPARTPRRCVEAGAALIDVGGECTRPGARGGLGRRRDQARRPGGRAAARDAARAVAIDTRRPR